MKGRGDAADAWLKKYEAPEDEGQVDRRAQVRIISVHVGS